MKKCFVACPIGLDDSDTRKRSDKLLKHIINPVCKECNFETIRVDNLNINASITDTIITHLTESDLVIADLTDHNPNVFYEIGYRSALKKPIIHLKDKNNSIPFDVSTIKTFNYDLSDLDSVDELKKRLSQTIKSLSFKDNNSSIKEMTSETFNSQILQELFKIQDDIKELHSQILANKDTSAISVLADKLAGTGAKSTEAILLESIMPVILNDPNKLNSLIELEDKINKLK